MILTCPDCSTRFAIDENKLRPDGRRVKCGKCAHIWYESAPEAEAEPAPETVSPIHVTPLDPEEQSGAPVRNLPALQRARKRRSARTGWVVCLVLLAAIVAVLYFGRSYIATVVPEAEDIYASAGIPAFPLPGEGLVIREPDPKLEGGVLSLRGDILNPTNSAIEVPRLRATIVDGEENPLTFWEFDASVSRLGPGESFEYTTQTEEVPPQASGVNISFTNPGETR